MNHIIILVLFLASGLAQLESARLNPLAKLLKGNLAKELDAKVKWNRKCKRTQNLEHGWFEDYQTHRQYRCDRSYTMNIYDNVTFECLKNTWDGHFRWKGVKYPNIELQHVKCEHKTAICPDPPAPSIEHRLDTLYRYQLQGMTNRGNVLQRPGYDDGDRVQYSCAEGYGIEPPSGNGMEPTVNESESYDYYTDTSPSIVDNDTLYLQCDATGKWNGTEVGQIDLPACRAISCDASEFENITHGQVVNYTTTYPYLGEMKVECDDGYMPVGGLDTATAVCQEFTSFDTLTLKCIEIQCPRPEAPVNGMIFMDDKRRRFNSTVTFNCDDDSRYSLVGQPVWRCGADGKWDVESCVTCQEKGSYCPAPCIPIGAKLVSSSDFSEGSEIVIQCKSGSTDTMTRKCLRNRQWSGDEVHCLNDDSFGVKNVGNSLRTAMQNISHWADNADNATEGNVSDSGGKSLDIGRKGGVHVYFLVDISRSITKELFASTMKFINTIIPMLGISDVDDGTRLALYFFASSYHESFNQHHMSADDGEVFTDYTAAMDAIAAIDRETLSTDEKLGMGSSLANGLDRILADVGTKQLTNVINPPQNALILISDGRYNAGGDPSAKAKQLKQMDVEIYSIALGIENKYQTWKLMQEMSSEAETKETHFFAISKLGTDLNDVIKEMISSDVTLCGTTRPHLTKIAQEELSHDAIASKHAWPWMAQIRNMAKEHVCGGSLIDDRHILTAAHCFKNLNDVEVVLKRNRLDEKEGIMTYTVTEENVFKHKEYNENVQPAYNYDIAILRLPDSVVADIEVHPVCLWNSTYKEQETLITWDSLYEKGKFGVVTGWGLTDKEDNENSPVLKQMQMMVKANVDCTENLNDEEKKLVDLDVMFCAGGEDADRNVIDTCKGDSGGPFVIRKGQTDTFIQTGIVSHGVRDCRDPDTFGFYTKLTEELLDWIKEKTKIIV